jgi:hypothetical protein
LTVSDVSLADFAAARACTVGADGVTAFVVGAVAEADGFLLAVGSGSAVGFGVAVSVGWAGSVGSSGVLASGVLVLPDVPVVVCALTTTPGATVVDVLAVVVLVVGSVAVASAGVVFGSVSGFGDAMSGPVVPAVSVDCTAPVDELSDDGESSAIAMPCPVAIAVPTPSATARRPTRPT